VYAQLKIPQVENTGGTLLVLSGGWKDKLLVYSNGDPEVTA